MDDGRMSVVSLRLANLRNVTLQNDKSNISTIMTLPFIAIGLIAIFIVYVVYLALIKKDMGKLKAVLLPGLFFLAIWAIIYYFLLK